MNRACARAREMLKPFGKKTNTAKRVLRILTVPLAACALLFGATSASADQTVPLSNHTVETVNPTGTTVNLFDYWVVDGANDKSVNINNNNGNDNTGINKGHQLKFNGGAGSGINKWTGRSGIGGFGRLPFVKNTLVNGYPEIKAGTYASYGTKGDCTDESLAYLFNNDSQANGKQKGKAVYNNVQGLFQLKDGYYVYDSYGASGNYAVYNPTTNYFNVYDKAGVYKGSVSDANLGQFFPFDSADKVFDEKSNSLSPKRIIDGSTNLNHHFGMSVTTEFVQPASGKTTGDKDMVFEFSGDDDVWVYIDGVLVGDLGGIHEKATLKINFATGGVHVGHVDNANDPEKTIQDTTIKAMFQAAGADTTNFSGNTFRDSTKHTLSFFYLERGAGASNMSLKFNLTTLPSSEVEKVDQNGKAVQDATFALYRSDADWNEQGKAIAQGTTDDKGRLVLLKPDRSVLSFDEEHADRHDYFVLKEVGLPAGYRSSLTSSTTATPGELHLQYKAAASGTGGVVVAPQTTVTTANNEQWTGSRMWLNGGYLAAKETISLSKETKDNKDKPISSGTTFAVVLKRTDKTKKDTDEKAWTAVTGNPLNGYKLCSKHGIEGAVEAAKSADTSVFGVNTKGDYVVTVRSLPGDIEKYAAMLEDKSQSEYTVAVYHTTASSLAEATTDNTSMVQYQTTSRQFSTVIHLTNVQNRLFVQKVDDLGKPVNGATFELYQAKDVTGDSSGTYAIEAGATPYDTVQANGMTYPYDIEGAACFPLDSAKHAPLIKGTYYLRESVSPDGHEINNTITKVIVDDSGVYVDAGKEGDGVLSMSGPGSLIASLAQFGSPDSIDNTLTHIKGKLQSTTGLDANKNLTWGQTCTAQGVTPSLAGNLMHMRYDKTTQGTKTILRYVEDGGKRDGQLANIYADTGINRMALYQEDDQKYIDDASKTRTNLGTLQLNHLFTTGTGVQYADRRVARLQVTKTVTADAGLTAPTKDADDNDLTFTFKFTLPDSEKGYEAHVFDANGNAVGNSFMLNNGDTHSIKAGETIRVYDLKKGDNYSVSELTTKGEASNGDVLASIVNAVTGSADESVLPAGFSLVRRMVGGEKQSGTGNTITGSIAALVDGKIPASNTLEFINKYSVGPVKNGLSAKKVLEGRNWADGDTFTVQLTADDGVPMPGGAKSKVATVELTNDQPATFGDITYTKPGTYAYTISEDIPGSNAKADGISYSAAVYTATVKVDDNHAGALVVKSVKVKQVRDDAGKPATAEVADKIATFTNRYDTHEHSIIIHAQKNLTDNAGSFPLSQNAFSFKLERVGGYADDNAAFDPDKVDTSIKAPMPQGAEGNIATVGNNADGTVTWPEISYTAKADAGRAYVYKFAENRGSVTGMTYDGSVYYAVVRNDKKGAGIQTSVEYYKAAENNSVKQLDENVTPSFTNIYSVEPTSVTLQGQKTVSGRDWNQGESYAFNLAAATDDAGATGLGKTTKQAVTDGAVAIGVNRAVASAPATGRVASFAFGTEAAPTVTFNRAGTFSFNITEKAAQDGQAGMSMDKHTARATVVVTDLDESGNHTGKLRVSSVTYANTGASDADKAVADKAAFTNAYHASGTFDGVTVSKTLEGRAFAAGQFTFAVTGLWYNGVQTSVDGAEASLSNKAAGAGVSGAVVGASGQEKLFARTLTEQDLGHTFAYRIRENQPAAAGYAYDTGYTGDAIVLVKVLARKDDPAKLYAVTTVLKGAGVTELLGDGADASALTDEKIVQLKQDSNTYVQQYDASEAGATTPTVSFVNRYTASLDYGAAGGLQIEKTLTYPKDATIFGSPKSTFRYIVKPADETSASKVGISTDGKVFETANVEADAPKTVSLIPAGGLTFTQDDAGKTFTYTVSEIDDKATGYTYDKTIHTVRAVVADNGDGTLRVTTAVSKQVDGKDELEGQWIYPSGATSTGVATVKFKNTYTVTEAATYTPSVTKVVAGADAPGKFTFAMTAADDATKTAIDGKLITGSSMSAENGYAEEKQTTAALKDGEHYKLDFSKLTFNKPGTYKFAINELAPNGGLGEWTYDAHIYTLTITATDEGGKLVARADGATGSEGFIFTNRYRTSTSYELQGGLEIVKTLNGHDLHAGMFGFTVTGEDAASTDKLNKLLRADEGKLTVTNDEPQADGTSHTGILGGLTFATEDAGKTFTYKVVENGGGKGGYTYDSTYWMVEIAVNNRRDGSLYTVTTAKHYDANEAEEPHEKKIFSSESGTAKAQVFFTNSYAATGTFDGLTAEKVMDSGDKIETGQYTFDLYAEKADGSLEKMDEGTTRADEDGTATVDFGKVNFKLGDATSGTHEQTIDLAGAVNDGIATKRHNADHTTTYSFNLVAKERMANLPEGVRPVDTSATCRVLLEVTDHNDGNLTSKVTYRDGTEKGKIVFHNTRDKVKTIGTVAKPDVDIDGQLLSVGDSYAYTINWANTEADAAGNLVSANVTVTDELPTGVVFEAFEGEYADKGAASGQLLTWNLGEQPAGSHGSVRVHVKITEDAVKGAQGAVGTINNTATVKVGDKSKSYTGTTTNFVPKKSESDVQDSNGSGVALGDELTYTIGYKNTEGASATVTITDAVPAGTEFVEFAGDHKDAGSKGNDGNLTWTLKDVPAGKEGTVQFKVRVTEDAFKSGGASGDISNQASVAVGNNPAVKTNTTTDQVSDGRLTLSKTVTAAEGITAPNKAFTFKVLLYQADGTTPLAGTFAYAGRPDGTNGTYVSGQIKSGDTIALKAGGSVTVTLPIGAHYEVQELDSKGELMTSEDGFAVVDKANPQKGTVGQATKVGFTNVYSVESTKVENAFKVQKKISGRNWTKADAFTMMLTAQGEAPMPKGAKEGVSTIELHKDAQVGNFGTIEYTKPGTYTYVITEPSGDETSLIFSKATYRATVTVADDGAGKLFAKTKIAQLTDDAGDAAERTVEAAVFTNTAKTGSLTVKKTVVGGDSQREFGFTVALTDGDGEPVSGTFGKGEHAVTFAGGKATFTLRDGGEKTVAGLPVGAHYTVTEDAAEGYTTAVNGADGSKAEGAVTEDGATVAFTNTVKTGELDVSKTVVAREGLAVDADKIFKFVVEATDAMGRKVSGTYGDATFEDGEATLKLKDGQTARITGLPAGTAYTVTERAADGYKAAVNGAEGSRADGSISADQVAAAAFTNTFDPAPATASVPELTKVLAGGRKPGLQEGEFTFVLSLTDGAGNVLEGYPIEAKNNKDGKVSFGELSFTNLGTYHATVTEKANGDVLIEDDAHAYTFDITVTQTGAGLKAEISNERGKKTFTNTFTPHDNTKTVTKADASGARVDVDGKPVGVGDTLTYTIGWANNSVDDRGAAQAADVTVTDVLPKGVDYVEGSADGAAYDAATRTLTWSLGEQTAGAAGTLSFDVKVSAEAAVVDDIANTATVEVGENESQTNTTHNSVPREGSLTVKKTVVGGDSQREFGFTVALTDGDGEPVSGTFGKGEHAVTFAGGKATFTLRDGGEKTVAGLPVGAHYTVTEDAAEGYTTAVNGADGSKAEGAVTEDGATVAFTNTYGTAAEGRDVSTAGLFTKTLEGRDWAEGDSFQFALAGEGGAPMPEGSADGSKTVSVTAAAGTKAGDRVAFDFGSIRYTLDDIKDAGFAEVGGKRVRAKTFTYEVREVRPDDGSAIAGVDYDGHAATMTVTVTDDGSGNLTATTPAIAQVSGGDFVNTYTTELDYSARAGVRLSKTLSGRAMEAGQFAFTVTADAETAAKLGLKTGKDAYAVAAADDGEADLGDLVGGAAESDVKFTDADAGKIYSFTVTETKLGGEGYTNDTAPRTVAIAPAYDAATGKLTVTTTVAKDGVEVARSEVSTADDATATPTPVTVAFENSYEATGTLGGEGNVAINATKTLTGRAAAAGEFSFSVRDARGDVVATATNRASGDGEAAGLSFSPIAYTTDALEQMVADGIATRAADGFWVISYTVSEDGTDRLPAGVTATASSFDITVKVTDDGKGGLDVSVVYPEGSGGTLSFVNGYGTNEATVDLAGTKTLAFGQAGLGLTQADIEGKYTFKIEPLDGAPAPVDASGKTVTEATNDAAGNVELGHVTFKQPSDLDDAEIDGQGLRTKTFAYRVSESGSVDGVVNDATATRTFTVRVVEDTNAGTLAAEVLPAEGTPEGKGAFEFTNAYGVNPTPSSVTDQIKVGKKLKGRDLVEGEFEFQLVEIATDGSESIAATGKNAADGTVALSPVTYTAPGTHSYELREVAGTADGVTYDRATYRVRTTVTDAGDGMLTVRHELADAEDNPTGGDSVTFTNGYEAAPVTLKLGAAKVLKGAELKAGQFSFELKSRDGKVMSTAKNAADGSVTFDALTFKQAGTYTFTVSEVDDGQAHVTYDKAVRKIVVTVSDEAADGTKTGYLSARVSYEGDANVPPVFTNSYAEEPGTPGTPENPGTPGGGSGGGSDNGSGSGSGGDGSKGGMPDTGDRSLPVEVLGAMAGIGALAVAGGAVLYRRRR